MRVSSQASSLEAYGVLNLVSIDAVVHAMAALTALTYGRDLKRMSGLRLMSRLLVLASRNMS